MGGYPPNPFLCLLTAVVHSPFCSIWYFISCPHSLLVGSPQWPWDLSLRDFPGLCMKCICRRSVIERGGSATMRNTNCRGRGKEVHQAGEGKGQSGKSGGIPKKEKSVAFQRKKPIHQTQSKSQRLPPYQGSGFSSDEFSSSFFLDIVHCWFVLHSWSKLTCSLSARCCHVMTHR